VVYDGCVQTGRATRSVSDLTSAEVGAAPIEGVDE